MSAVHVVVVHPRDIAQPTSGGIQTFLRDFIRYSPADFQIVTAGVTNDERQRPIGRWQDVQIGQRTTRFIALAAPSSALRHPFASVASLRAAAGLRRELTSGTPILQLHRPYRQGLFVGHRGPRVRFIHVDLESVRRGAIWRRLAWLYRGFADDVATFDMLFIANEAGALALRARYPEMGDRIRFLSGWYDASTFHAPVDAERPQSRAAAAEELGLAQDTVRDPWVVFAGRLEEVKDPTLAVDAFAELVRAGGEGEAARLLVCGDGELRDSMRAAGERHGLAGRLHFLGDQPRAMVARLMASADVLLVTSRAEGGGPRVVLEALGAGLPVVTTVVGEVRRSITTASNGWLAEERTPQALASGLRWALSRPRAELSAAAVAAAAPFEVQNVLKPVYDLYRDLALATPRR